MSTKLDAEIVEFITKDLTEEQKKRFGDLDLYYGNDENSNIAKDILRDKYLADWEKSPLDMWIRIAWAAAQPEEESIRKDWAREFVNLLADFKFIPGGRINYGLGRDDINVTFSNCYVVPIKEDSLDGIYRCLYEEAKTYKAGGGCGHDLSILRPKDAPILGTGGNSCGTIGFMDLFSSSTHTVQQNHRRGANMQTLLVSHPDIEEFITIKCDTKDVKDQLRKIVQMFPGAASIAKKINKDFIEKKRKVQHSNISVKLTDEFLRAMEADGNFDLRWGGKVHKTVRARDLWDKIISTAWESAEPGLIFWDRMVETNNLEYCNPILSTNPCIVGSSLIAVADGRNAVTIEQLYNEGKDVPVYSTNLKTGQVEIKWGRHPRKTGVNKEVWKLTLDDGSTFVATPNHKVLCKDLTYKPLKDLVPGDSIFPFNSFESNKYRQISSVGKRMIGGARRNRRQYRVIHEFYTGGSVDAKHIAIHHRNFKSFDDSIDNLQTLSHKEHRELHASKMRGKNNPYFRASNEWRANFRKLAVHPGETNGRYLHVTNEQLLEHGRALYEANGKITKRMWAKYAKDNALPMFLGNAFRFGKWSNFASLVVGNHKVVSIEPCGKQDVYNITVDDNHNYHVITSFVDPMYINSSGICVKNCSEIPLGKYGNCLLGHMNLLKFVKETVNGYEFDHEDFEAKIATAMRFLDNVVTLGDGRHALPEQNECAKNERRTGLGITGLGDMLVALGYKYGSKDSLKFLDHMMAGFRNAAYNASCSLAEEKGVFPWFDADKFLNSKFTLALPKEIRDRIRSSGIRNGMLLTVAPVGSGSIIAQTSSGIEPIFRIFYIRKVKKDDGISYEEYRIYHPIVKNLYLDKGYDVDNLPDWVIDAAGVKPADRVATQAVIQKYIDNSISSTVNLPANATKEDVAEVYLSAWKLGCKGITVYREGSREGVLLSEEQYKEISEELELEQVDGLSEVNRKRFSLKRPLKLSGETFKIRTDTGSGKGPLNCYYTVNFFPNSDVPYEILITEPPDNKDMKDVLMLDLVTRCASMMLRHRIPLEFIIEQFEKIRGQYIYSLPVNIAKVLRNYLTDGKGEGEVCPECGSENIRVENGCYTCADCGKGKCS